MIVRNDKESSIMQLMDAETGYVLAFPLYSLESLCVVDTILKIGLVSGAVHEVDVEVYDPLLEAWGKYLGEDVND
jgi:hypothetical protein